uniref:Ig-like domain-containing protein n=1 Tax=Varanus komodoensis TaxID=61221 RepID=A0A8D2L975_VARKO
MGQRVVGCSLLEDLESTGQSVDQTKGTVTVREGDPVLLNCTYQSPVSSNFPFWYIQRSGQPPKLFLSTSSEEEGTRQGFDAKNVKKTYHLEKSTSQLKDSAVYFCAVSDTVRLWGRAAHQKLARGTFSGEETNQASAQI